MQQRARSIGAVFLWLVLVALVVVPAVYEQTPLADEVWCLWRRCTGWPCPGCGLTRSLCAMARLEVGAAFAAHLAGPWLYVSAAYGVLFGAARAAAGARVPSLWSLAPRVAAGWWMLLAVLVGLQIARTAWMIVDRLL